MAVTVTPPWPIETETVSPGNHWTFCVRIFHSGLGMRPLASYGRSMPDGALRPSRFAYLEMRSISSRTPTL